MSQNIATVNKYLEGFRRNDHEQILSCLTDDITRTVFGAFRLTGKAAYDKAIDGAPEFLDPPELEVVRMVEQGDVVMAELTGKVKRAAGGEMRMSMAEVFVLRDGRIAGRRTTRGEVTGGPAAYDARAKQAFAAALDRVLTRLRRPA